MSIDHDGDARTAFRRDRWLGERPLASNFPALFSYCKRLNITVRKECEPASNSFHLPQRCSGTSANWSLEEGLYI
jgi:hypothetical protein